MLATRVPFGGRRRGFLRHRHGGPTTCLTLVLQSHDGEHMCSERSLRILDADRNIEQRLEALTHEELARLATHEDGDRRGRSRRACSTRVRSLEIGTVLYAGIGH